MIQEQPYERSNELNFLTGKLFIIVFGIAV